MLDEQHQKLPQALQVRFKCLRLHSSELSDGEA